MIYLTGDIHGSIDISKINKRNWKEGKRLTKDDYLIILGDFGILWNDKPDSEEKRLIDWLTKKKWTTLFIDGNHENYNRLKELESVDMFGSKAGKINSSIYHLKRGHIYQIEGQSFLSLGGAKSTDYEKRIDQESWWPEEIPSQNEIDLALKNLSTNNMYVDYLLCHTIPTRFFSDIIGLDFNNSKLSDPTTIMLEKIVSFIKFKHGYSGHFHLDKELDKWTLLFNNVVKLKEVEISYA